MKKKIITTQRNTSKNTSLDGVSEFVQNLSGVLRSDRFEADKVIYKKHLAKKYG